MFRVLILLLFASPLQAQVVTEGAAVTSGGRMSVEAAVTVTDEPGMVLSGPEALVRVGLGRGVEARAGLPDYRRSGRELGGDGFSAPSLGLGLEVGAWGRWAAALVTTLSMPLDGGPVSPLGVLAVEYGGAVTVGAHLEGVWDRAEARVETGAALLVIAPVAGPVSAFGEVSTATQPDGRATVLMGGAIVPPAPWIEVEARVGVGLGAPAPRAFGGLAARATF